MKGGLLEKVVEGVYWLPPQGYSANCFIVCGKKALVIDPGLTENGPRVAAALKELGIAVDPANVEIALTHGHADHCMAATGFAGVKARMHRVDAEKVNARDEAFTVGKWFGETVEKYPTIKNFLAEGDEIDLGGVKLAVLHLPGHTAGSVGLLDEERGILFGGDVLFKGSVGRWDLPSGDKMVLRETLLRLRGVDFELLCPGHGDLVTQKQRENIEWGLALLGL